MTRSSALPAACPAPRSLTRGQKAAVIVHLLARDGVDAGVDRMPANLQRRLLREMATLRLIDRATLAATVREFASELDCIGLHVPSDPAALVSILHDQLSLETVEAVADEAGDASGDAGQFAWARLAEMEIGALLPLLEGESAAVCAVLMSKLPAEKAAKLLGKLPDDRADAIVHAFDATAEIGPGAVSRIGLALGLRSDAVPAQAFPDAPLTRVGGILTAATSTLRDAVLARLAASDPDRARRLRAAIFSFENVPDRIDPRDLSRILRALENDQVTALINGAPDTARPAVEFLLANISSRLADQLREEAAERGEVLEEEVEAAMSAFVAEILSLERAGEIRLAAASRGGEEGSAAEAG